VPGHTTTDDAGQDSGGQELDGSWPVMTENAYFDGDPATQSARRHLERVLKQPQPGRRWPWAAACIATVATWYLWPRGPARRITKETDR